MEKFRINLYEQLGRFYQVIFSGQHSFRTSHISLYIFLLSENNRTMWSEWFQVNYNIILNSTCIGSSHTYYTALKDLKEWELLDYKPGVNIITPAKFHIIKLGKNAGQPMPLPDAVHDEQPAQLTAFLTTELTRILPADTYKLVIGKLFNLLTGNIENIKDGDIDFLIRNNKILNENPEGNTDLYILRWKQYLDMRKQKGKELLTEQGRHLAYTHLKKLAGNNAEKAVKILEQSIQNEWLKLYQIK